jgi:hypothetical protein
MVDDDDEEEEEEEDSDSAVGWSTVYNNITSARSPPPAHSTTGVSEYSSDLVSESVQFLPSCCMYILLFPFSCFLHVSGLATRDVFLQMDCDDGMKELMTLLKWKI